MCLSCNVQTPKTTAKLSKNSRNVLIGFFYGVLCDICAHSVTVIKRESGSRGLEWVFSDTFNNISLISWWSVLVEKTRVPRENYRPAASHWQTLSHNALSSTTSPWAGFELTTLMVIGIDCICSCNSNYHTITMVWIFRYQKIYILVSDHI